VSLDEAIELLTTKPRSGHSHVNDGFLTTTYYETSERNVAFCDGHATWMGQFKDAEFPRALFTAAGGEQFPFPYDPYVEYAYVEPKATTVIKWGVVWSLTLFVILSLLPLAWIRRRETKKADDVTPGEQVAVAADATGPTSLPASAPAPPAPSGPCLRRLR
jgi:prepilin-type processing-associated H-X9-DG protein